MHIYTFEVKLFAIVRIRAENRAIAERALEEELDCTNLMACGANPKSKNMITEASLFVDDEQFPYLIEYDGIEVEDLEFEPD